MNYYHRPPINTRHLLAGHGARHIRAPLPTDRVAQRIADSITLHATHGVVRQPEEYTSKAETLAAVEALLKGEN